MLILSTRSLLWGMQRSQHCFGWSWHDFDAVQVVSEGSMPSVAASRGHARPKRGRTVGSTAALGVVGPSARGSA